jgi:serine protease Do
MDFSGTRRLRRPLAWGALLLCLSALASTPAASAQNMRLFQTTTGNSSGAYLGVTMQDVTAKDVADYRLAEEKGVIVRSVQKGSPAEAAAVKEDDVILEFAGQQVASSFQLSRIVQETPVGRKVALVVSRDGKRVNLSATLEAREPSRAGNAPEGVEDFLEPFRSRNFQFGLRPQTPDRNRSDNRRDGQDDAGRTRAGRPQLGVQVQALSGQLADYLGVEGKKGALVTSVASGSASEGKLKAGDVIVGVGEDDIDGPEALTRAVRNASGQVTVKIVRDKKPVSVKIDLPDGGAKDYRL